MIEQLLLGSVVRFVQAFVQAVPTILIGLLVAGVFQRLIGRAGVLKLFGDNSWRSLPQAWLIGMLLPVCSLGVIPVAREMRRSGVSGGAILAFALTAPLFNPISVLYGLTLSSPIVIFTFCLCSLIIVAVVGLLWDRLFPGTRQELEALPKVAEGYRRILAIGVAAARELAGPTLGYILIGLLGVSALSIVLPYASLQTAAEHDDWGAPLFMSLVAIPAYATPMTAIVQLASMFQHGNSVGAAFALLALGAGANLGLIAWMVGGYGPWRTAVWFGILLVVVLALAYGVDQPLYPEGVDPAGHTHAFDIYCSPFHPGTSNPGAVAARILKESVLPHELVAVGVFAALLLCGIALATLDPGRQVEQWLERATESPVGFDWKIPGPVLGSIALVGLVGLSVFGCYVYYPPQSEIFEELRMVNTEVVTSAIGKDWENASHWIPVYEDWTRKLQVSTYLREGHLSRYHRMKARVFRDKLELLEHAVEERDAEEARELGMAVDRAYRRMRSAYLGEPVARSRH